MAVTVQICRSVGNRAYATAKGEPAPARNIGMEASKEALPNKYASTLRRISVFRGMFLNCCGAGAVRALFRAVRSCS